jgi:YVTN family beta-propeller protein
MKGMRAVSVMVPLLGLLGATMADAAPRAWVTNNLESTVSVVDTASNTVVATVPVGLGPVGVVVNGATSRAYVANTSGGSVTVVNTATNTPITTVPVASLPVGIAVDPVGTTVYVTNFSSSLVSVIDAATNAVVDSIPVGNNPSGIAVHPSGGVVYVANSLSGTVSIVDPALGAVVDTIPVGTQPEGLALDPSGGWLYVANGGSDTVSVIDTGLAAVVATVPVGVLPSGIAVHPNGSRVYVHNLSGTVSVIDSTTHAVVATVTIGAGTPLSFQGLGVEPSGRRLYVARPGANAVAIVDTATNTVTGSVAVGLEPLAFGAFIGPCAVADDCNDANPCTDDACNTVTGACVHTDNTAPCTDGNACTIADVCAAGTCTAGTPADCSDGNPCTNDSCDSETGACGYASNTASCSDGNACTTDDTCQGGSCVGGAAPNCNDGNGCTDDGCDPATGCTHANNTAPCNDGNACTTSDVCQGGACAGGTPPDCSDGNACTDDACDPASGCTHTNNAASCSDGNACTTGDVCQGGSCVGGAAPDCNDSNPCTDDSCNPATGCVHADNSAPCDDDNACTLNDACQGGTCTGAPLVCNDGNACTDDLCDSNLGCLHANNSQPCSDANTCTVGDACNGGTCVGGNTQTGCAACQAVADIPAQGGIFVGATTGTASSLSASCAQSNNSPERVFRWVPTTSGLATIFTCGTGTNFDTIVFLRSTCGAGADLACNDDTPSCPVADGTPNAGFHGSRIAPTVTAGQTYYIVVDGWNGKKGNFALTVVPPSVCGNNVREGVEQCDGTDVSGCPSGQCAADCRCVPPSGGLPDMVPEISDVSIERNATVSSGDVAEGCAESTSGVDLLRFSVKSKNQGTADLALGNPGCPSPCSSFPLAVCADPEYVCSPAGGHNHPHYSNYARYDLLDTTQQAVVVGHKQGFCLRDSVACATPQYTCDNQGVSAGCDDIYSAALGCQYLDITGIPSGNYSLRVTLDPFGRIGELNEGNNIVAFAVAIPSTTTTTAPVPTTTSTTLAPSTTTSTTLVPGPTTTTTTLPPGGACGSPTVVPAAGGVFNGTTAGTSTLAGTCAQSDNSPEKVFQWTPSASGTATIFTCGASGTNFDTVVYLRQGTCGGTQIACNDDTAGCATSDGTPNAGQHASRITPTVTAGQTYFIVVDGWNGRSGNFQLTIVAPTPPVPTTTSTTVTTTSSTTSTTLSQCASPTVIPAGGGVFAGTTSGPSTLAGTCATSGNSPERVFQWTPATSGTATLETCSVTETNFDTILYVRGTPCVSGAQLTCNDDTQGCPTGDGTPNAGFHGSRVTLAVTAGQTYFVVVDGYNGNSGNFRLNVISPP